MIDPRSVRDVVRVLWNALLDWVVDKAVEIR